MARDIRVDIVGDSGSFNKAALAAAAELEMLKHELSGTSHNFDALSTSIHDSSGKIDPFTRDMQLARKASLDAGDAILKATKLSRDAGVALGDTSTGLNIFQKGLAAVSSGLDAAVPLFGTVGGLIGGLPVVIGLAIVAVVALADVVGTLIAVVADLIAPVTMVVGLLGGLGAAFAYVAVQSFKNKATLQQQKDALLALHVAQQTYNQDLAKYGQSATQTEKALLALHAAQDKYAAAQQGVALGTLNLDDKFHSLVKTLSQDFAPQILALATAASTALTYLGQIAKLPLDQAFKNLATHGVKLLGEFVDGVAKVAAKPIRLAFQVAFGSAGSGFQTMVASWWHRLTAFLFGYTAQHRMNLPLDHQFAPITKTHVDGIFQPLIDWFNHHHFTKQGTEIGHTILAGFTGSGAAQRIGDTLDMAFVDAFKNIGSGFEAMIGRLFAGFKHWIDGMGINNQQMIARFSGAWDQITGAWRKSLDTFKGWFWSFVHTIEGWWKGVQHFLTAGIAVHINFPSPPSWLSKLGGGIGIPGLASGGVVTKPTLALIGESGPEAVVPLSKLAKMGGGGTVVHNTITLDGRQLAFAIRGELIKLGVATGQPILRGYA